MLHWSYDEERDIRAVQHAYKVHEKEPDAIELPGLSIRLCWQSLSLLYPTNYSLKFAVLHRQSTNHQHSACAFLFLVPQWKSAKEWDCATEHVTLLYHFQIWTMEMHKKKCAELQYLEAEFMCHPFQPVEVGAPQILPWIALSKKPINSQLWKTIKLATSTQISAATYLKITCTQNIKKQHHCGMPCSSKVRWFQQLLTNQCQALIRARSRSWDMNVFAFPYYTHTHICTPTHSDSTVLLCALW